MSEEKRPRKTSSVRHTRAVQKNRVSHPVAAPSDEQIRERIQEIVHPATLAQVSYIESGHKVRFCKTEFGGLTHRVLRKVLPQFMKVG